ncbi:MAG: ABC transporter substrate-binding protein [Anaerolineaceae bacterium]|nr:ABC transporter substrate-binding protein [Anaerolineaceae bacterium]
MKKHWTKLTAVLLALTLFLGACAAPAPMQAPQPTAAPTEAAPAEKPTEATAAQPAAPAAKTKIVFWRSLTGAAGEIQDELVQQFNASQNEVEVEVQFQGAYGELLQKLQAALIAGTVPDLVQLDSPFVVLFAKNGALVPLESFVNDAANGVDLKDYVEGFVADGYYDGKLYSMPYMRSTPLLYYNKAMFAEAGLPDKAPETWDEFVQFSEKLTKIEGDKPVQQGVSFTMTTTTAHWYLQALIYAYGGQVSDAEFNLHLSKPEAEQALQVWQDMIFKSKTGKAGVDQDGAQGDFLAKRVAMTFGSTGSMANLMSKADFEVGTGMIPGQVKKEVPVGGSVIAMTSKDTAKQAATWKLMKFLTSPSSIAQIVVKTGYLPISQSAKDTAEVKEYYAKVPQRAAALEQLQFARPQASVISLAGGTEILRILVEETLVANMPIHDAMLKAETALKTEYEENFK